MIKFGKNRTKVCVLFYKIENSVYTEIQTENEIKSSMKVDYFAVLLMQHGIYKPQM